MENELDIVCQDCGVTFVFAPRGGRGSFKPPTRCSLCRAEQAKPPGGVKPNYTGDPNEYRSPMACDFPEPRHPRRTPRKPRPANATPDENVRRDNHGKGRNRRYPKFAAVCAKCGSTAHVPFEPSKFQEVLCRSCYQERRGGGRPAQDPASQS